LNKALQNNKENFNKVCCYIANIFHKSQEIFNKKKVLYIYGESNSKKTTLVIKPLINFFELQNIGFITMSSTSNFNFQNLKNKVIIIIDEFKYIKKDKDQLLKLFAGEPTIIDIKFKEPEIIE
jgi:ABC-type polar amino acid transport system ATPase subunit